MTTSLYILSALLTMGLITYGLRLVPFVLFKSSDQTPAIIRYLGKVMPSAIIIMLIIYSIRAIDVTFFPFGLPEILGIGTVVLLHIWRRQYILSIIGGTLCYMAALQVLILR